MRTENKEKPAYLLEAEYASLLSWDFGFSESRFEGIIRTSMRLESHCSLAYGAQGLMFWALVVRPAVSMLWAPYQYPLTETAKEKIQLQLKSNSDSRFNDIRAELRKISNYNLDAPQNTLLNGELVSILKDIKKVEFLFLGAVNLEVWSVGLNTGFSVPSFGSQQKWMKINSASGQFIIARLINAKLGQEMMVVVNVSLESNSKISMTFSSEGVIERTGKDSSIIIGPILPGNSSSNGRTDTSGGLTETVTGDNLDSYGITSQTSDIKPGDWRIFTRPISL